MSKTQSLLLQLESLLRRKKSKEYYCSVLGVTKSELQELMKELKNKIKIPLKSENLQATKKVNVEKGIIESTLILTFEPKDDIELARLHKIDLSKYVITNYWSKLLPNGNFTSSVFSKRKQPEDYSQEDFEKFLKDYRSSYKIIPGPSYSKDKSKVCMELSIADYHLAKKHIDNDNDQVVRAERYFNIAESLTNKVQSVYNIDTIILPISNDFFHTDNYQNQTTNGTPQDTIMDYSTEYEVGFDLLVKTIEMCLTKSENVHVVLVQGNHDRTKSFYLAHALAVYFKNESSVTFDREHGVVKGYTVGETFIGWHHGNCKIDDLPLLFATHLKYSKCFGNAKYREVHTGDKHHYMAKEIKGVRIQQMPSLSGTDRWHLDNNFVHSVRAAVALVYDLNVGKVCEFESRI